MYQIAWADTAKSEYYENLSFWMEHNKSAEYPSKIIEAVENAELLLAENPFLGKKTTSSFGVLKSFYSENFTCIIQ